MTDIFDRIIHGNLEEIEECLERGVDIDTRDMRGDTPSLVASQFGIVNKLMADKLMYLLSKGASANVQNNFGYTLAMYESSSGRLAMVKFLFSKNVDINIQNKSGDTALMFASMGGHLDVVEFLISKGANANLRNRDGFTALSLALQRENSNVARFLADIKGPFSLQHLVLNLIEISGVPKKGLPEILFER